MAIALASLSDTHGPASPEIGSASAPPPLPAWIEISRPEAIFSLDAPALVAEAKTYEARRHRTGGGRQDVLVFGGLDGSAPFLRLMIYRVGEEPAPDAAFFVDLARRAAEAGRGIARAAQPTALLTRLGVFEVADLNLTRSGAPDAACLGFRLAHAARHVRITGFACGGAGGTLGSFTSKSALACLLDGIELAPAAEDGELAAFFAARELNGDTACVRSRPEPAPARSSRFDESDDPPLRQRRRKTH